MAEKEIFAATEPYLDLSCALGEGPFYEQDTAILRFVDIIRKELHTVDTKAGPSSHRVISLKDSVGITADIEGKPDEIVVGAKFGFASLNKTTGELKYIKEAYEKPQERERMRFNDGAVDSRGRFWAGSMNDFHVDPLKAEGTVFRLDPDLSLHRVIEDVAIPNGMGWSLDDKVMYFTDSPSRGIYAYDFDADSGTVSNRRMFFQLQEHEGGVLDGCTIDSDGCLWSAHHEGSRVIRISPDGQLVGQVNIPAWKATCPAFGGPNLDELFITSAGVDSAGSGPPGTFAHGGVFRIKTSAKGRRPNKFRLEAGSKYKS